MNCWKEMDWWYWLVTDGLLIGSLAGWPWDIYPAIALTSIQTVHYLVRERRIAAFPVQVRLSYLLLLVLGMYPPLGFIHWIQLAGTTAVVMVGYCPLARIMVLMSWNRRRQFAAELIWNTIISPPVAGSVMDVRAEKQAKAKGASYPAMIAGYCWSTIARINWQR